MGQYEKLIQTILQGKSDANINFKQVCNLMIRLGFEQRIRGSHHLFRKSGVEEK